MNLLALTNNIIITEIQKLFTIMIYLRHILNIIILDSICLNINVNYIKGENIQTF